MSSSVYDALDFFPILFSWFALTLTEGTTVFLYCYFPSILIFMVFVLPMLHADPNSKWHLLCPQRSYTIRCPHHLLLLWELVTGGTTHWRSSAIVFEDCCVFQQSFGHFPSCKCCGVFPPVFPVLSHIFFGQVFG